MSYERSIVQKLYESRGLSEATFQSGGSEYKCVFGKYYKDGELIDRDAYFAAKEKADSNSTGETPSKKDEPKKSDTTKSSDNHVFLNHYADSIGSKMKKGKEGPYFYDSGDTTKFNNAVADMAEEFSSTHAAVSEYQLSSSQKCYYDEDSGMALVVKNSSKPGSSWVQMKKLTDEDLAKLDKSKRSETPAKKEPTEDGSSTSSSYVAVPKYNSRTFFSQKEANKFAKSLGADASVSSSKDAFGQTKYDVKWNNPEGKSETPPKKEEPKKSDSSKTYDGSKKSPEYHADVLASTSPGDSFTFKDWTGRDITFINLGEERGNQIFGEINADGDLVNDSGMAKTGKYSKYGIEEILDKIDTSKEYGKLGDIKVGPTGKDATSLRNNALNIGKPTPSVPKSTSSTSQTTHKLKSKADYARGQHQPLKRKPRVSTNKSAFDTADEHIQKYAKDNETTATVSGKKVIFDLGENDINNSELIDALKKSGFKQKSLFRLVYGD